MEDIWILDGGLATELEASGADITGKLWSAKVLIENPDYIVDCHLRFLQAGADIITTCSYQASLEGFLEQGLCVDEAKHLIQSSVSLAKQARQKFLEYSSDKVLPSSAEQQLSREDWVNGWRRFPLVAASIGCYGAILADGSEYHGNYRVMGVEALFTWHRPRLELLLQANPDMIACETIPCLEEVEALALLFNQLSNEGTFVPKVWISLACQNSTTLNSGQLLEDAIERVEALDVGRNIYAVGINCTAPSHITDAIKLISDRTSRKIIVYPNRGETWDSTNHQWTQDSGIQELEFAEMAFNWCKQGCNIIGGCCRMSPSAIKQLKVRILVYFLSIGS